MSAPVTELLKKDLSINKFLSIFIDRLDPKTIVLGVVEALVIKYFSTIRSSKSIEKAIFFCCNKAVEKFFSFLLKISKLLAEYSNKNIIKIKGRKSKNFNNNFFIFKMTAY